MYHNVVDLKKVNLPQCPIFPSSYSRVPVLSKTMKVRILRLSSSLFVVAIHLLLLLNSALAGGLSLLSERIEQSSHVPRSSFDVSQNPPQQDLWVADSLSSSLLPLPPSGPPSIAPTRNTDVIVADADAVTDSKDDPHAFCVNANTERGSSSSKDRRKLRIRNADESSCAAPYGNGGGGILNNNNNNRLNLNLPDWATPWKPKKKAGAESTAEQHDYNSCLGVFTPVGMLLPFHLCCFGIVHAYINGLADRISKCVFDYTMCESYAWGAENVCCQTFSVELGSEYATGINCLPRI